MDTEVTSNVFGLQLKLENCLRSLTKKYNELSKRGSNTSNLDKKDEKFKPSDTGERRASTEGKPYKKLKLAGEKTQKSFSARAKGKRTQPAKSQTSGYPEKSSDIPKVVKNDSSRFWSYVDQYCADLNSEDIKVLEKWIESHETDVEYQNIPDLGVHYSSKWMEDEILEERKEGSKCMENPKGVLIMTLENSPELEFLRKVQDKINSDSEQPPLVKNLISSLVQENIISSPSDIMTDFTLDDNLEEKKTKKTWHSDMSVDARLRLQLADLGVLEGNCETETDDELLQELKRLQNLLIPISELNLQKKKALLLRAKAEIAKQEAQKRIQETDAKVMESYRMMTAARSRGKKLSKKELSQIRSILEERDTLNRNTKID